MMALFGAAVLSATPVVVTNFGFEADVLADNAFTTNTFASGWTCSGGCGSIPRGSIGRVKCKLYWR